MLTLKQRRNLPPRAGGVHGSNPYICNTPIQYTQVEQLSSEVVQLQRREAAVVQGADTYAITTTTVDGVTIEECEVTMRPALY